jgi:hypothetical protein
MIVHNGSSMPYRDIIVENLHYYVDVLLDTLMEYYHFDMLNHESIYRDILSKEMDYYKTLGVPFDKKAKQTIIQITNDNALKLIFNEYNGNFVKKAIDKVAKKNKSDTENKQIPQTVMN